MKSDMKAVILAAGRGTRMGDLTQELPKPMLKVHGKPVLEIIITRLRDSGKIKDFFIVVGYQAEVIQNHFKDGKGWNVNITYGTQEVQNGTGKAPEVAKSWVGADSFLLTYGDILVEAENYSRLVENFTADGVIAVKLGEDLSKGGAVLVNSSGYMEDLIEKASFAIPPKNAFYNAGIYIFTPRIFEFTEKLNKSPRGEYELTDAMKNLTLEGGRMKAVHIQNDWVDVRDPQVLATLNKKSHGH
jgi:dTDP-glucose pyrophosphorylase